MQSEVDHLNLLLRLANLFRHLGDHARADARMREVADDKQ